MFRNFPLSPAGKILKRDLREDIKKKLEQEKAAGKVLTEQELNQLQWVAPGVVGPVADEPK